MNEISYMAASQRLLKSTVAMASAMVVLTAAAVIAVPQIARATGGNEAIAYVAQFDGRTPNRVAFTLDGTKAYVTNKEVNSVSVIDTQTQTEQKIIQLTESGPTNIAVSPDGSKAYVLNQYSNSISVIDTKTDELAKVNKVQGYTGTPYGIAFHPAAGKHLAYVTNNDPTASVSIIDTSKDTQIGTVTNYAGDQGAIDVAFAPDGTMAYVTTATSIVAIDVASGAQKQAVDGYTGTTPRTIAFTPDGEKAYITNQISSTVSVIDPHQNKQTGVVSKFTGVNPAVVAVTPNGKTAYVTSFGSDTVSVIDVGTDTETGIVNLGDYKGIQPNGVAFSPPNTAAGDVAYVVNRGSNNVTVIQVPPAPAVVNSVSPNIGSISGRTNVLINGKHLTDSTGVTFGGVKATTYTPISDGQLSVVTPPAPGGLPVQVDVVVQNKGGDGTKIGAYTYTTDFAD